MRLTAEHVARVFRDVPAEDIIPGPGMVKMTGEDYAAAVTRLLASGPQTRDTWFFAYGSLIWKPACEFVEIRTGIVRGWHRAFCLGWNERFRGSPENPGLMLALDRGGACKGVLYRFPPDAVQTNLNLDLAKIAQRVILKFDHEPELKARIAQTLLEVADERD